jgi:hypothetical protein
MCYNTFTQTKYMPGQNYSNHKKYYTLHHFIFYPVLLAGVIVSTRYYFTYPALHAVWFGFALLFVVIAWLSFMVRQHYAMIPQNRIIRLEMRFRYYILTQQRFEPIEQKLSFGQIAALRFAGDEELPVLVKRAVEENLTPDAIKRSIKNWVADDMRV